MWSRSGEWRRAPKQILRKNLQHKHKKAWPFLDIRSAVVKPLLKAVKAVAAGIVGFRKALLEELSKEEGD